MPAPQHARPARKRLRHGLTLLATSGLALGTLTLGGPAAIAAPGDANAATGPYAYAAVASPGDGTSYVAAVDLSTGIVAATIPVPGDPTGVVLNPAGTQAYVLTGTIASGAYANGSGYIVVIDTSSNTVAATIPVGGEPPYGIAFNPAGTLAYTTGSTSSGASAIVVIDTSTDTVTGTIPVSGGGGIALNPAGTVAYVPDENNQALDVVDLATGTVTASVPIGADGVPVNVGISPDGSQVYTLNHYAGGCSISVFGTGTDALTAVIPLGGSGFCLNFAVDPAGPLLYVPDTEADRVSVIDTSTDVVAGTIPLSNPSFGVAFGGGGAVAYAGNGGALSVIDTATSAVTGTIPVIPAGDLGSISSITVAQTVLPTTTATSLTVSPSGTADQGDAVTLTATEMPATAGTMQFFDGASPVGSPVAVTAGTATYATSSLALGSHSVSAVFTPSSAAFNGSTSQPVTLQVIPPPLAIDQSIISIGTGTVTTAPFSTTGPRLLVAFTSSDGGGAKQTTTVTGAELTWTLVQRANTKGGSAEIWAAEATGPLTNATVTSKPKAGGYDQSLTVVAFTGAGGIGASVSDGKAKSAPSVSLTTTEPGSWVVGVGQDYSHAVARTLGPGQSLLSQWVDPGPGETFWVQDQAATTPTAGTTVTINDTAPTTDIWDLAAVEILPAGSS